MNMPIFIITIDTEGNNIWKNRDNTRTENARYLERFQSLCERFGFKPVWLTNYEMAKEPIFVEFAKDVIGRGQGEIGMHLHAWNSPPDYKLTDDDYRYHPYLIEFPEKIMREKVIYMTHLLEDTFSTKMLSHRAGRWALNSSYVKLLIELNYQVDCSVTPRINWCNTKGIPKGNGGPNYLYFPDESYFVDEDDISKIGTSSLLEVPMSIHYKYPIWVNAIKKSYDFLRRKYRSPSVNWLRPSCGNFKRMISIIQKCFLQKSNHIEFMLHSSELMPGGSPTFKDEQEVEELYRNLEKLFEWIELKTKGMTLAEFYQYKNKIYKNRM